MAKEKKSKKLSSHPLFYQEIPFKLSSSRGKQGSNERIRRKSREKQTNIFEN